VTSTDQVEARYLLTPDLMERLHVLAVAQRHSETTLTGLHDSLAAVGQAAPTMPSANPIVNLIVDAVSAVALLQCAFIGRNLYIAIPSWRNRFEFAGVGADEDAFRQALRIYRQVRDILAIVDALKIQGRP
jgi:hypothetical protein